MRKVATNLLIKRHISCVFDFCERDSVSMKAVSGLCFRGVVNARFSHRPHQPALSRLCLAFGGPGQLPGNAAHRVGNALEQGPVPQFTGRQRRAGFFSPSIPHRRP